MRPGKTTNQGWIAVLAFLLVLLPLQLLSTQFPAGDVAPYNDPDGQLNAGDALVLQRFLNGDLTPTQQEQLICDVAPLGGTDGILNVGDLTVLYRAILGQITLPPVDIGPDAPVITTASGSTSNNPFTVDGTATQNLDVRLYVNGEWQSTTSSGATGSFSFQAALYDGSNIIHATAWDGQFESQPSQSITVDYTNSLSRNIGGSGRISSDTVWTPGVPTQPYTATKILTIQPGVTLTIMPGAEIQFKPDTGLNVEGQLVVMGEAGNPVLLNGDASVSPTNRWHGIQTLPGATGITMDYAEMELSRYGVIATEGVISITNSVFQNIDNPVVPVDVNIIHLSGNVTSATIADNQFLGTITGSDYLAAIHTVDVDAVISGNLIDGFDNGIRVGSGSSPAIGPDNSIINNTNGIRIEPQPGANADPAPAIFNNSIHTNGVNLLAGTGFDDPAVWWVDAQANWWGSADPVVIAQSVYDFTDISGNYTDNIPSVDFTRFLDAPGGNEATGNYLFGRITADTTFTAGSNYIVLGKLAIAPAVTLTINEGSVFEFVPEASLASYGNLMVSGKPGQLVKLTGVSQDTSLKWGGIQILQEDVDTFMDYAEIERSATAGISFPKGDITNSFIHDNDTGLAVYWKTGQTGAIGSINIQNSHILNNTVHAVSVSGVPGCAFCGPELSIRQNVISGSQHGIDLLYAGAGIHGNQILNNDIGVNASSWALNIPISIIGNEISNNARGVVLGGGANGTTAWAGPDSLDRNDLFDNNFRNVELEYTGYSFTGVKIYASDNWWGTASAGVISATIKDTFNAGESQPTVDFTPYRTSGPGVSAPILDYETTPSQTQSHNITGTAEPNSTLQLFVNGIQQNAAIADPTGAFSAVVELAAGANGIYAIAIDGTDTSNPSKPVFINYLPTVFPAVPVLNPVITSTNDNPVQVSGLANPNVTVNIYMNGEIQGVTSTDGNGLFSYLMALKDGQNTIFVTEGTGSGQTALSDSVAIDYTNTIDRSISFGAITVPTVWTMGNGDPYVIGSIIPISNGASLTIEEGVVLEFYLNAGLAVDGELNIHGTVENPVTLTSKNGISRFEQWKQIEVNSGGLVNISHAVIQYGTTGVWFNGGSGSVEHSLIRKNRYGIDSQDDDGPVSIKANTIELNETGIRVGKLSSPQITDENNVINNTRFGIDVLGTAVTGEDPNPVVNGNNIYGNTDYDYLARVFYDPSVIMDAGNNWWGTTDIGLITSHIFDQDNNPSSPIVNINPVWQTVFDTTIPAAPVITGCTSPTNQPACTVSGTAEPGREIQLYINGIAAETATADAATGAFTIQTTLSLPGTNLLYATARNGVFEGATSNTVYVIFDSAPPVITLTQPSPGSVVNYAVIAGLLDEPASVTVAGEAATVFSDNSFAHALAGLSDGPHTVQIVATDSFGQNSITSVTFTLDSQPPAIPDTGQIAVGVPAGGQVTVSSPINTAISGDTVTLLNSRTGTIVQTTVPGDGSYSLQVTAEAGDELVITISDPAGNTTASRVLIVAGAAAAPGVSISAPLAGSTIDDDTAGVIGTYQGPANVGIEVNGYTASKAGEVFCVGDIPLQAGSSTLTVTARTPDGTSASQQVTVNSTGPSPLQLEADQVTGIAPLTATFSLTDNTGLNLNVIDYDVDGDGSADYSTGDSSATITHTYTEPGCYIASVNAQDTGAGGSVSSSKIIAVQDLTGLDGQLRGIFYGMLNKIRNSDFAGASAAVTETMSDKFNASFALLSSADLNTLVDSLGVIAGGGLIGDAAEYTLVRMESGIPRAFTFYFVKGSDGIWRIAEM